ncbi:trimeric intracellular cation channel family protein [Arthrobacter monumenti]
MNDAVDVALILDLLGVFSFAVSGCLLAARKGFDIVGSLLLGSLVGLGGGVVRDLIIDAGVPAAFSNPLYIIPPLSAALLVYFLFSSVQRFGSLLVVFDAGGLALFCVTGTLKALEFGLNPVSAVLLGVTTAVGGGLLRDVTANEVPKIFDPRDVYAIPAFAGAFLVVLLDTFGWSNVFTTAAVAVAVFAFRILAWRFSWRVPLAVQGWHR